MNLLLVTFSLRNPQHNYDQFFVELRGNSLQWWHYIEQTCVVATYLNAGDFAKKLTPRILTTDSLLVVSIEPYQFQGWLPKEAWDWLAKMSGHVESSKQPLLYPPVTPPPLPSLPPVPPPASAPNLAKILAGLKKKS